MLKFKKLRQKLGLTQEELRQRFNMKYNRTYTAAAISQFENGKRTPETSALKDFSNFFGVSIDYLLEQTDSENDPFSSKNGKGVKIPVLGRVVAGIPLEATTEILDWEEITPEMALTGEYFALQIKGSSMMPRIQEGDVVIVKKQPSVESGEIAIVLINGDEATIKQVYVQENGIMLQAYNPTVYPAHFYNNEEIQKLPVCIIGKVVELRGKF
ncbi:MAG: LexA family transcriptional regulator [Selenomonadaceae bacterium]